jgi:hypothetical protein
MGATAGLTTNVSYGDSQKFALNRVALLNKPAMAPAAALSIWRDIFTIRDYF